jgi:hypothetical protein
MNSEASVDEATESIAYDTSRGVAVVNGVRANFPEFADKTPMRFGVLGASLSLEALRQALIYAIKKQS